VPFICTEAIDITEGCPIPGARKEKHLDKYRCTVCGYVYDPAVGDPEGGVTAGTPFEALPEDWVCPECGAAKDMFERLEE
jgi:rubredoxin